MSDTVSLSSRVRFARNLTGYNFPSMIKGTRAEREIVSEVTALVKRMGGYTVSEMRSLSAPEKAALTERYVISPALAESVGGAVAVRDDGAVSLMINEEDHIREQSFVRGADVKRAYEVLSGVDKILCANLHFARNGKTYYTACPTNYGTGMRASVMMYLPALVKTGGTEELISAANAAGLVVRGGMGEGSPCSEDIFQVSNRVTVGDELAIVKRVSAFVARIVRAEKDARYSIYNADPRSFEDDVCRALGTLKYCRLLSYEEFVSLIGKIKLGVFIGFVAVDDAALLDDLFVTARSANLELLKSYQNLSAEEKRAAVVKDALAAINCKTVY